MKTVKGNLTISVNVECPACEDVIDLLTRSQFIDDGYLLREVLEGDHLGCKNLGDEFTCPSCGEKFIIGDIEW